MKKEVKPPVMVRLAIRCLSAWHNKQVLLDSSLDQFKADLQIKGNRYELTLKKKQ